MTCKCLGSELVPLIEIDGSVVQRYTTETVCLLGRDLTISGFGGITRCENTPHDGPCWVWQKVHKDTPDVEFQIAKFNGS